MVKFQIMSDLHIEYLDDNVDPFSFIEPEADILILAGDIGRIYKYEQLYNFINKLSTKFKYIIYVLGNHEYYYSGENKKKYMNELFDDVKKMEKEIKNLYILDKACIKIEDICIIGCTLWSYVKYIPSFIVRIHDINTYKYNKKHEEDLLYIKKMINYCKKNNLKCVIVTHHPPTFDVCPYKRDDKYKDLYGNNLDYLLDKEYVNTWICGHVHNNFDYLTTKGTHLLSNQKGKKKDNITDFNLKKIIDV